MTRTVCAIALAAPLFVACSGSEDSATPTTPSTSTSPSRSSATPEPTETACPNPEGQACLGTLAAGTYATKVFHPAITYTVPAGWKNYEDTPGNFLLVPPHGNLPGVNAGTGDFIGIYSSAAPPNGCEDGVAPGSVATPAGYRTWAMSQPGFQKPHFQPAKVGGLSGLVADLRCSTTSRVPWPSR